MSDHIQAPAKFDPIVEAQRIEDLAHTRLDTANTILNYPTDAGIKSAKALVDEWHGLSDDQRALTANELVNQYHNADLNFLPVPSILTDMNGKVAGIHFDASNFDYDLGPASIRMLDANNMIQVQRQFRGHDDMKLSEPYLTDYVIQDKAQT